MFAATHTMNSIKTLAIAGLALAGNSLAGAQDPVVSPIAHPQYSPIRNSVVRQKQIEPDSQVTMAPPPKWDGEKPFMSDLHAPQFPAPRIAQEMLDAFRPAAAGAFNLQDVRVQEMRMAEQNGEKLVPLSLPQGDRIVRMHSFTMRDPNAKLLVQIEGGTLVDAPWPPPATYRGTVDGEPDIEVAASIMDGKVSMMLRSSDPDKPTWFVQPLSDAVPGLPDALHVVYRGDDLLPNVATCGVDDVAGHVVGANPDVPQPLAERVNRQMPVHPPAPPIVKTDAADENGGGEEGGIAGDGGIASANVRCQIAYDADVEFYQSNGSNVTNTVYDMEMIMNNVGLVYQGQVGISYTDTGIIVRTAEPDPYASTNANTIICEFENFWNANVTFPRDVAQLFSGKDFDGTTVGLGWIGAVCITAGNCNGGSVAYSIVQSKFTTDLTSRIQDSAHELGHNWNGCHCNTGTNCNGTSNPNNCGIMTSAISGSLTFDSNAVAAITGWRDSHSGCFDPWFNPTYVNWAYNGTETGSASQPWNTIFEGLDACLAGGELDVQAGNYFQNPNIYKAKTIKALNGTVRIGN